MSLDRRYERLPTDENVENNPTNQKYFSASWRVINFVMTIFFLLAAFVQVNDPDPFVWVPVYCIPAVLCLGITINPSITGSAVWRWSSVVHISLCLAGIAYTVTLLVKTMDNKLYNPLQEEEGRELGGLVIIVLWLCLCRFTSVGSVVPQQGSASSLLVMSVVMGLFPLFFWALCFIDGLDSRLGHCKDMFPGMLSAAT